MKIIITEIREGGTFPSRVFFLFPFSWQKRKNRSDCPVRPGSSEGSGRDLWRVVGSQGDITNIILMDPWCCRPWQERADQKGAASFSGQIWCNVLMDFYFFLFSLENGGVECGLKGGGEETASQDGFRRKSRMR